MLKSAGNSVFGHMAYKSLLKFIYYPLNLFKYGIKKSKIKQRCTYTL